MALDDAADVARIEEQEKRLIFPGFSNADAWELGNILVRLGNERSLPIAIDIYRADQQLFHAGLTGSSANNDAWIQRKIRVVRLNGVSSFLMGARYRLRGISYEEQPSVDPYLYAAAGGCFPVNVKDTGLVGTVGVSGLPQEDDHALIVEAIEEFLKGK